MILLDRHVWLIGASSGIGAALATALAQEGAVLALSARREENLEDVASKAQHGSEILVRPLDVKAPQSVENVARELTAVWGSIDILIYSAGTWTVADINHFDSQDAVDQIDTNLLGLVRAIGAVMPQMVQRRQGEIVGIASIAGYAGIPRAAAYCSSKAGENAFLQAMRMDLQRFNVGVTTVNPGFVQTPMTDKNDFFMPFMVSAEEAARTIVDGLLRGDAEIHFPKRLSVSFKLFTALPRWLYELLAARILVPRG